MITMVVSLITFRSSDGTMDIAAQTHGCYASAYMKASAVSATREVLEEHVRPEHLVPHLEAALLCRPHECRSACVPFDDLVHQTLRVTVFDDHRIPVDNLLFRKDHVGVEQHRYTICAERLIKANAPIALPTATQNKWTRLHGVQEALQMRQLICVCLDERLRIVQHRVYAHILREYPIHETTSCVGGVATEAHHWPCGVQR